MQRRRYGRYDGRPISSKAQSKELVLALGLNTVESRLVTALDVDTCRFLNKYDRYGVRYMVFGMPSQYALTPAEALAFLKRNLPKHGQFRVDGGAAAVLVRQVSEQPKLRCPRLPGRCRVNRGQVKLHAPDPERRQEATSKLRAAL